MDLYILPTVSILYLQKSENIVNLYVVFNNRFPKVNLFIRFKQRVFFNTYKFHLNILSVIE